jgi:hypothetical protein
MTSPYFIDTPERLTIQLNNPVVDLSHLAPLMLDSLAAHPWTERTDPTHLPSHLGVPFTGFATPSARPRYEVWGSAPRFGSRDEIVGSITRLVGVAFTRAWAEHLANREGEDYSEVAIDIYDREAEPPKAWAYYPAEDLPF